ncbi:IclR family transcriptional regulator [Microbispora sp. H10836]|uniref:IclR family transcriptional regulator n=1 Tax=Microbispora sp. H10836 TaxID=2729106 RepID=UPI001475C1AF|nr:IclR family transcriptional regulator [Microbispora sp. H10836]
METLESGSPLESVDRALRLVEMLRHGELLTVKAAAERLAVAPSTAHRLLGALIYRGFAVQDRERRYRAGPAISQQHDTALSTSELRATARAGLDHLHAAVGETVQLMVLQRWSIKFIDGIECDAPLRVGVRVGDLMPAYCSAGGKALLAELSNTDLEMLHRGGLPPWPTARIATLAALKTQLMTVRRRGYGMNNEETEQGVSGVGVAIRDPAGKAVAAFTVAVPSVRFDRSGVSAYVASLREAVELTQAQISDLSRRAPQ